VIKVLISGLPASAVASSIAIAVTEDGVALLNLITPLPGSFIAVVVENVKCNPPLSPVAPVSPVSPLSPVTPVNPVSPRGIVKSNSAAADVPILTTLALVPAAPVVVDPTAIVAAAPVAPVAPVSPRGIEKSNIAWLAVPTLATVVLEPAAPVETVPIVGSFYACTIVVDI